MVFQGMYTNVNSRVENIQFSASTKQNLSIQRMAFNLRRSEVAKAVYLFSRLFINYLPTAFDNICLALCGWKALVRKHIKVFLMELSAID